MAGGSLPPRERTPRFADLVGGSPAMKQVYAGIERLARSHRPALLFGEAGTGKTAAARAIHAHSKRRKRPFHVVQLAGVEAERHALELFGRWTEIGTVEAGAIEQASPGVLLISGLETSPREVQSELLAALKAGAIQPRGGSEQRPLLTRLLFSFREDLETLVKRGDLHRELAYTLAVQRLHLPALRERIEDLPYLLSWFVDRKQTVLEEGVLEALLDHDWPGNVRELENLAARVQTREPAVVLQSDLPQAPRRHLRPARGQVGDRAGGPGRSQGQQERGRAPAGHGALLALPAAAAPRRELAGPRRGRRQRPLAELASDRRPHPLFAAERLDRRAGRAAHVGPGVFGRDRQRRVRRGGGRVCARDPVVGRHPAQLLLEPRAGAQLGAHLGGLRGGALGDRSGGQTRLVAQALATATALSGSEEIDWLWKRGKA